MRRIKASLPVLIAVLVLGSCEQKAVNVSPATNPINWQSIDEFGDSRSASTVWGSSANDVYVGYYDYSNDNAPRLRHYDGTSWTWISITPGMRYIEDIWGSGPNDVYVASSKGLWHFDGATWTDTGIGAFRVLGTDANNVMATNGRELSYFNGTQWSPILSLGNQQASIRSFWVGPGPRAVAFLDYYYAYTDSLLRLSGGTWSEPEVSPGFLGDFWGPSDSDITAVGVDSLGGMIWHWNGTAWADQIVPEDSRSGIFDIFALASNELYAPSCDSLFTTASGSWQALPGPESECVDHGWGTPGDFYFAGNHVSHFDGNNWSPVFPVEPREAFSLWADTRGHVVIGGGLIYRLENGAWTEEGNGVFQGEITVIAGSSWSNLYAATDAGVYHDDGTGWALLDSSPRYIDKMTLSPTGELFATGGLDIYRYDSQGWQKIREFKGGRAGGQNPLWAFGRNDVLFGDYNGILRYDGSSWKRMYAGGTSCDDIWAASEHDIYGISGERIIHGDGSTFAQVGPVIPYGVYRITGTSPEHVIAVGPRGYAAQIDGHWLAGTNDSNQSFFDVSPGHDGSIVMLTATSRGHYRLDYHR